jgi:hypothetical protein
MLETNPQMVAQVDKAVEEMELMLLQIQRQLTELQILVAAEVVLRV